MHVPYFAQYEHPQLDSSVTCQPENGMPRSSIRSRFVDDEALANDV